MGDFSRGFHRPDAGSHTVEGNVSGPRAMQLEKQRQIQQELFEEEKTKRQKTSSNSVLGIHRKFQPARIGTQQEEDFRSKTVGLVSAKDFLTAAQTLDDGPDADSKRHEKKRLEEDAATNIAKKEAAKKRQKRKMKYLLSFTADNEEDGDVSNKLANEVKKDPTIDTSFLPDKQRQIDQEDKRKQLEMEWKEKQYTIRKEPLEVVYSFWDGSGHRRTTKVLKGFSVGDFLDKVRQDLVSEFKELSNISSDALMYVKEDLILPHDITFYDLIATKARGKSGPLFHFDVHEDVRLGPIDSRVEKDEAHPGKVIERRWYERNKHIFPASRWQLYDPAEEYGIYTIRGGEVNNTKT